MFEKNHSSETDCRSVGQQKSLAHFGVPNAHNRVHKIMQLDAMLSQFDPDHTIAPYLMMMEIF